MKNKEKMLKQFDKLMALLKGRNAVMESWPAGLEPDELETMKNVAIVDVMAVGFDIIERMLNKEKISDSEMADMYIKMEKYKREIERLKSEQM